MLAIDFRIDVAIHQQQIGPAVIIEIQKHRPPAEILGVEPETGCGGCVGERAATVIFVKRGCVIRKICFEDVEMAISVVVADGRSHASLLPAIFVESSAGGHRNIRKGPIVVVAIKNAGRAVAGDENVGPAVFVEVEGGYAEGVVAVRLVDVGFRSDILKGAIAAIVIQDVLRACQSARAAHDWNAFPNTSWPIPRGWSRSQIEIDIVRGDEIEIAVAIVIYERATCAPCFTGTRHPGILRISVNTP